jgi:hypothetical protein
MEFAMSLSKMIAIAAAPVAVLLLAVPALAQADKAAVGPSAAKAAANVADPVSSARRQSTPSAAVRGISKAQATGGESGSGQAATADNDPTQK